MQILLILATDKGKVDKMLETEEEKKTGRI